MTSVDTNLLVRFLTRDDEKQYQKARGIFEQEMVYVPETVLLETEWVLRYAYEFSPGEIHQGLLRLLGLPNVQCGQSEAVRRALAGYERGLDFADALHLSLSKTCERLYTFDKAFVKKARGISACEVCTP